MFQRRFNEITDSTLFYIPERKMEEATAYSYRFICSDYRENLYTDYLKGFITENVDTEFVLRAISYNSASDPQTWKLQHLEYNYYDSNMNQALNEDLCVKIKSSLSNLAKERVDHMLLDYHILLNMNDEPQPIGVYPTIWHAIGYFETFPITYFPYDFTREEMDVIANAINSRRIICKLNQNTCKVYYINKHHNVDSLTLEISDPLFWVKLPLSLLIEDMDSFHDILSSFSVDDEELNDLHEILF